MNKVLPSHRNKNLVREAVGVSSSKGQAMCASKEIGGKSVASLLIALILLFSHELREWYIGVCWEKLLYIPDFTNLF